MIFIVQHKLFIENTQNTTRFYKVHLKLKVHTSNIYVSLRQSVWVQYFYRKKKIYRAYNLQLCDTLKSHTSRNNGIQMFTHQIKTGYTEQQTFLSMKKFSNLKKNENLKKKSYVTITLKMHTYLNTDLKSPQKYKLYQYCLWLCRIKLITFYRWPLIFLIYLFQDNFIHSS